MAKDACIFYKSYYEAIKEVPEEYQLEIYNAIFTYAIEEKEPGELSPVSKAIFTLIRPNIDSSTRRYETNINNGKKGRTTQNRNPTKTQ